MDENPVRVLLIEDRAGGARQVEELLAAAGAERFTLSRGATLAEALEQVGGAQASPVSGERRLRAGVDVLLFDLALADGGGADPVSRLREASPELPIVVLTSSPEDALTAEAMAHGAQDFLVKGQLDTGGLVRSVRYAIEQKRAEESGRSLLREQAARASAEAAEQRWRFLAEAGRLLASSLDDEQTLSAVGRLSVPLLGDVCLIDLIDDDGALRRLGVAHRDVGREASLRGGGQVTVATAAELGSGAGPLAEAIGSRAAVLGPGASGPEIGALFARGAAPSGLRASAWLVSPLVARERTLGAITLVLEPPRAGFGPDELELAAQLSARVALAVDNTRLYREAQQAAAARDHVVAVVSHDLRNPLFNIQMASDELMQSAPPACHRHIEIIRRAGRLMNRLIQDLLDVTKIEAGRLGLECQGLDLAAVARDAVELHAPLALQKSLQVSIEAPAEPARVRADKERMTQAVSNLLHNAIKYTPDKGRVVVRVEPRGQEAWLLVKDTGPGIPPEHLPRVFDRFWQARRQDRRGTGLGLAIARGIVEAHGGRIWVESQIGAGSTFAFAVPREAPSAEGEAKPAVG